MSELTPLMQQYQEIKSRHKDKILFFRLGDFYEMFGEDAEKTSRILNLILTHRHGVPMCGIPHHSAPNYLKKLLETGNCVAICEQITKPGEEKGIIRRDVVEVLTPGTVVEEAFVKGPANNFLLALAARDAEIALACLDVSTGDFQATSFVEDGSLAQLKLELAKIMPSEILVPDNLPEDYPDLHSWIKAFSGAFVRPQPRWMFNLQTGAEILRRHFQVATLNGFGLTNDTFEVVPCGILLDYLGQTAKGSLTHVRNLTVYNDNDFLQLDEPAFKNLEVVKNLRDGSTSHTLFEVVNQTRTAHGSRLLRQWLQQPLKKKSALETRQTKVQALLENKPVLAEVRQKLLNYLDLPRLASRIALDKAFPKDLLGIKNSLEIFFELAGTEFFLGHPSGFLQLPSQTKDELQAFLLVLQTALNENPPPTYHEGGIFKAGFSPEIDQLRDLATNSDQRLNDYLEEERLNSDLPNLKLKYNKIIGYFFELTKSQLGKIPDHFQRRQSMVGGERYSTERLQVLAEEILGAQDKLVSLERTRFLELRDKAKTLIPAFQEVSQQIAELDVLQGFAHSALTKHWVRPDLTDDFDLEIAGGRHPVVEASLTQVDFIPNSTRFSEKDRFQLVTGPNMAGKSTYLRQVAILTLMAQTGCWVPADRARISLVDKIFCRVGASDNLARGESTFLVEMNETAAILRGATEKSLIIMDEVGRGTSTNDGLAMAWSIAEYILDHIKAKTLFATHFHELTELQHPLLSNHSMDVYENGAEIVFLKKVKAGPTNNSYGVHVAQMAGVPLEVIRRAYVLLEHYSAQTVKKPQVPKEEPAQTELFPEGEILKHRIGSLQIDQLTPLQALNILADLQKSLKP